MRKRKEGRKPMKEIKKKMGTTKILLISLVSVIIIGAVLLSLPICNKQPIKMIDSLFVATSAVCVTGLTTVVPIEQFSVMGQMVLLALIQIGGIGFMTLIAIVLITIGKKLNLSDKLIIKESLNQDSFKGLVKLVKKVCLYTFIIEIVGACILAIRFIPDHGLRRGIWFSIFHSISAFCNAGFDLLGANSIVPYANDWLVCGTIMMLIIIGGLGFTVWDDIIENIKNKKKMKHLTVHTKLVLSITTILLISGTIFIFVFEKDNMQTMGSDTLATKILKSAFQSTTLRTAGFFSFPQNELTSVSKFMSMCYMFVGGSPASTAGGIKTVTLGVIILLVINYIKGRKDTNIFNTRISQGGINRAIIVFAISIFIVITSISLLLITEDMEIENNINQEMAEYFNLSFIDIAFEAISAFATVGLTLGITTKLTLAGRLIIIALMIIGRLGPITISIALFKKHKEAKQSKIQYPQGNILIG